MITAPYIPFARLALFLLLSLVVHGGVFLQDWATMPAERAATDSRVTVTLLPAVVSSPAPDRSVEPPAEPKAVVPAKPVPAAPKVASARAAVKPPATRPSRPVPLPTQVVPYSVQAEPAASCPEPREESAACPTTTPVAAPAAATTPVRVASLSAGPAVPVAAAVSPGQGAATGGELVEAVPAYRSNPLPEYPFMARKKRWEGVVWLLVDVSAAGGVDDLRVERSCGHGVLDRAAATAVRDWRFSPATRGGVPVASQVRVPVRFRLEDG